MMGAGLCWLDYNNDGWMDLFVVNSYADDNLPYWNDHGGLPTSALYENVHGHFVNVTKQSHAGLPIKGEGCVAADLDGDGHTDLYITAGTNDALLWNNGNGTFTEGARKAGVISFGWHAGATVADVNGDGRPDLFVAGYADMQHPIATSVRGFPGNYPAVRDELFLNEGHRRFREVGARVGLDPGQHDHSLGAVFTDVNGDGRPDLYVANDTDPNRLYLNEPGGPLGFHFVDTAKASKVADAAAGMGIAASDMNGDGKPDLFITQLAPPDRGGLREQGRVVLERRRGLHARARRHVRRLGRLVDRPAEQRPARPRGRERRHPRDEPRRRTQARCACSRSSPTGRSSQANLLKKLRTNGRGLAAADYDNDGRVDVAINSIGGPLVLLRNESKAGNWLEVNVRPFSPGAVVTAVLPDGRRIVREVQAGSSYLSSEDPRVHFGLGAAKTAGADGAVSRRQRAAARARARQPDPQRLAAAASGRSSPGACARACRA